MADWQPKVDDQIMIKSTGKIFTVTKVEYGRHHHMWMVRVLDNHVPKWYYVHEVKPA